MAFSRQEYGVGFHVLLQHKALTGPQIVRAMLHIPGDPLEELPELLLACVSLINAHSLRQPHCVSTACKLQGLNVEK